MCRYWLVSLLIVFIAVPFIAVPGFAEYYQYTDQNGNLHFTDNPAEVPADRQQTLQRHESVKAGGGVTPSENPQTETASVREPAPSQDTWDGKLKITARELDNTQAELHKTFEALQAEKAALGDLPEEGASPRQRNAYEQKAEELNRKIDQYEQQCREFQKKVDAFNTQIGR